MVKQSFCLNDPPIREPFWQKDSLITYILFELWLIMIFSSLERKLAKRTSVQWLKVLMHGRNIYLVYVPLYYHAITCTIEIQTA